MFQESTQAMTFHHPQGGAPRFGNTFESSSITSNGVTRTLNPMTTGTSVLGIKFNGGVVVAADMLGSYGSLARFPSISRITKVNENTVIGATGDYADFQFVKDVLELITRAPVKDNTTSECIRKILQLYEYDANEYGIDNDVLDDGHSYSPKSVFSWLTRFMYNRRSRFNPLWNTIVCAGFKHGQSFLGYVDKLGTAYEDNTLATGYGAYIARPLLRDGLEKNPNMTQAQAVKLVMDCLKVLFYRDARSLNKFEVAVITDEGVTIESGLTNETNWEIAHMIKGYN